MYLTYASGLTVCNYLQAIRHSLEKPVRSEEEEEYKEGDEDDLSAPLPYDRRADHSRLSVEEESNAPQGGFTKAIYDFADVLRSVVGSS
jgi:hypothetical protein